MSNYTLTYNTLSQNMERYSNLVAPVVYQMMNRLIINVCSVYNNVISNNNDQWIDFLQAINRGFLILINPNYTVFHGFSYIIDFYHNYITNRNCPANIRNIINEMRIYIHIDI